MSKIRASCLITVPDIEKEMKARGRRSRAFCFSVSVVFWRFYLPLVANFIFFLHTSPGWFHYSIKLTIARAKKNNSFVRFGSCRSFLIDKRVFVFSGNSHLNPLPS